MADVIRPATVDGEHLGRDPSRLGRGQERDGSRDLFGFADPAHDGDAREACHHLLPLGIGPTTLGHVGAGQARRHRVHRDALGPEFQREATGQDVDVGLGGRVEVIALSIFVEENFIFLRNSMLQNCVFLHHVLFQSINSRRV